MMKRIAKILTKVPSWLVMLLLFVLFYFTGWHKEIVSQLQKVLLISGIMDADAPEVLPTSEDQTYKVAEGFKMIDMKSGQTIMFDQFHGNVVFLNLWATWCPPCKAEMPGIQALYETIDSDKIKFIMLSLDQGGQQVVENFIEDNEYTFPVYRPAEHLPEEIRPNGIPATYIISAEGQIVFDHAGIANYNTDEIKEFLKQLSTKAAK